LPKEIEPVFGFRTEFPVLD